MKLPVAQIDVGPRLRDINAAQLPVIVESIRSVGLLNPITVAKDDRTGRCELLAGAHRLEAVKRRLG